MAQKAILTVGLNFGDEGKGGTVDYLTRRDKAKCVVRYNGGAQAGHRVVTPEGQKHVFSQYGAGTLAGADTFLSQHMLVNPFLLIQEREKLRVLRGDHPEEELYVDERALITVPYHRAVNRIREWVRSDRPHGSCGLGIGETMDYFLKNPEDAIRAKDLVGPFPIFKEKLMKLRKRMWDEINVILEGKPKKLSPEIEKELSTFNEDVIARIEIRFAEFTELFHILRPSEVRKFLNKFETVVFEGAQGALLDEWFGFHPYTTWSTTHLGNAYSILRDIGWDGDLERVGILRAYGTRHGPGPFPTEFTKEEYSRYEIPDPENVDNKWQRRFRLGWHDLVMDRYALRMVGKLDYLAVTNYDRIPEEILIGCAYDWPEGGHMHDIRMSEIPDLDYQTNLTGVLTGARPIYGELLKSDLLPVMEETLQTPIGFISTGPTYLDRTQHEHRPS